MLLTPDRFDKIYFYRPFADFRKGIAGLSCIVQEQMILNPFERHLFIFCNRQRNRLKVLYWDQTGFALWYKHLEQEKFHWPRHCEDSVLCVERKKLEKFLEGLDPFQRPHKKLNFSSV